MAAHRIPLYFNPDDHDSYDLSSYSVTARGHVRAPHHGVREHPEWRKTIEIPDWADEDWKTIHLRQLGLQHVRPDCAASHTSAAVLHGMAVPQHLLRHSHVTSMIGVVPIRRREASKGIRRSCSMSSRSGTCGSSHVIRRCGRSPGCSACAT